jgi:hypothetical protein
MNLEWKAELKDMLKGEPELFPEFEGILKMNMK